jgi:putative membrane protein
MTYLLINWLLSALVLLLVAYVVPGFRISGFLAALIAVILIGFINATLGLFLRIVTFPLTIITLGLFLIVVNALVLKVAAWIMPGFSIRGFLPALIGAIFLSILHFVVRAVASPRSASMFPREVRF